LLQPQIMLPDHPIMEPRMEKWTSFSPRLGGGHARYFHFDEGFFSWWKKKIPMIEDFPYSSVDFRGSNDLVLPEGARWDVSGTHDLMLNFFLFYIYIYFLVYKGFLIKIYLLTQIRDRYDQMDYRY
jgi:hypothetical protein